LQSAEHCKPAQILGQWIVEKMREGVPVDMMLEPISREIGEGYEAAPQIIDIEGYFSKGAKNPKYTIVEFADFECPHCKATASVLDDFVNRNSNTVKLVYKYFPLNPSPTSKMAALAVEAAGKQGKFWQMHDAAFRSTTMLTEDLLLGHAKAIGLKIDQFKKDMNDKVVRMKVERSLQEALRLGLKGTPSIFFNGRPYHLSLDRSGIDMRLAMESARNDSSCK
jgi:protein-disulfide isomerase